MERKLAAILSADVKGYSQLIRADDVATIRTLDAHRELMTTLVCQHEGRVAGTQGDNLLAEFSSVVEAVQCAVEMQHALKASNAALPAERQVEFRMGVNLGDIVTDGEQRRPGLQQQKSYGSVPNSRWRCGDSGRPIQIQQLSNASLPPCARQDSSE